MELREPEVTDLETIEKREGFQSIEPVKRPDYWGVDLDWAKRPGVPMLAQNPKPMANAEIDIVQQQGTSAVPMHGRPNKTMPKVFGTATPMKGLSGVVRRAAYSMPDHKPQHWLLKLFADRVDSFEYHAVKYGKFILPVVAVGVAMKVFGEKKTDRFIPVGT